MPINLNPARPDMTIETTRTTEEKAVKHSLYDSARSNGVKQEVIASVLQVNQSTVSRMMNPNEPLHLSVSDLSLLHKDPFTSPIADDILMAIDARFNITARETNGSLLDEMLDLSAVNGKLAEIVRDGIQQSEHGKLRKLAAQIESIALYIKTEVDAMERGGR